MTRQPPISVIKALRSEVGFVCPIPDCFSPYLSWHHFDPPWHENNHHNPNGMIALCLEHHNKADAGAYTKEQLHNYKQNALLSNKLSSGKFDWMRNRLFLAIGGNLFLSTSIAIQYKGKNLIWFTRNEHNYILLNIEMLYSDLNQKVSMRDNSWICYGIPSDIECPPSGKILKVTYSDSDQIGIIFNEFSNLLTLRNKYPTFGFDESTSIPVTIAEIELIQNKYGFIIKPDSMQIPNKRTFVSCIIGHSEIGIRID